MPAGDRASSSSSKISPRSSSDYAVASTDLAWTGNLARPSRWPSAPRQARHSQVACTLPTRGAGARSKSGNVRSEPASEASDSRIRRSYGAQVLTCHLRAGGGVSAGERSAFQSTFGSATPIKVSRGHDRAERILRSRTSVAAVPMNQRTKGWKRLSTKIFGVRWIVRMECERKQQAAWPYGVNGGLTGGLALMQGLSAPAAVGGQSPSRSCSAVVDVMRPTEYRPYPDPALGGRRRPRRCPQFKGALRSITVVVAAELGHFTWSARTARPGRRRTHAGHPDRDRSPSRAGGLHDGAGRHRPGRAPAPLPGPRAGVGGALPPRTRA
jgi:hypothetical protein